MSGRLRYPNFLALVTSPIEEPARVSEANSPSRFSTMLRYNSCNFYLNQDVKQLWLADIISKAATKILPSYNYMSTYYIQHLIASWTLLVLV